MSIGLLKAVGHHEVRVNQFSHILDDGSRVMGTDGRMRNYWRFIFGTW